MVHKEQMEWLKENDPITYYELTSNPTGADGDNGCIGFSGIVFVMGLLIYLIFKYV